MSEKKTYRVARFEKKADIDWAKVPAAPIEHYGWIEDSVTFDAEARLAYAEDFGFVCRMTCAESSPAAVCREFNGPVCNDSCMEFFVIFAGDCYLNLEANSIGTKHMGFGPGRGNRLSVGEKIPGGFPAIPEIAEDKWSVTYELSLADIAKFYPDVTPSTFVPGYTFTGNFYKTGSAAVCGSEHYGMWNEVATPVPDFHQPPHFGVLIME